MPGFSIGVNAVRTAAQLMDVSGDNIANANTPGYHAKRALVVSEVGGSTGDVRVGLGASVEDVRRIRNELVEHSLLAYSQVEQKLAEQLDHLTYVELLFAEPSSAGVDARLGEFFDAVAGLAADPDDVVLRENVLQQAQSLSDVFHRIDNGLRTLDTSLRDTADYYVEQVNALTDRIAQLNRQIKLVETSGTSAPTLKDNRDQLIANLATLINVTVHTDSFGVVNVSSAGTLLVSGNTRTELSVAPDESAILITTSGGVGQPVQVREGRLAGIVRMANDVLPELRGSMDELANSLRRAVNLVHTTSLGLGGRFHTLTSENPLLTSTPLDQLGYGVPAGAAETLVVNVEEEATGEVTQYELTLDTTLGADAFLAALRDSLNAGVGHVTAGVDDGKITLTADDGYAFGFATPYDPNPAQPGDITAPDPTAPAIVDAYEAETDLVYEFTFLNGGEIGTDTIDVQVQVRDPAGPVLRTFTRTVDESYVPGAAVALENGLKLTLSEGNVAAGDGFSFQARGTMDSAGVLDALGLGTFFNGLGAAGLSVSERVRNDPSSLGGAIRPMRGDNHRLSALAELRTSPLMAGGTTTLSDFYRTIVSEVATTKNTVSVAHEGQQELVQDLQNRRDAVSGVSVDEEMVRIIQSRTLYQGALRYISAVKQMMSELAQWI